MAKCILCLEEKAVNFIQFHSQQWLQFDILKLIEKYFWPIENLHSKVGICFACWEQLYDFHIFHKTIEEAHRQNVEFVNQLQHSSCHKQEAYNEGHKEGTGKTKNGLDQKQSFPMPFVLIHNDLSEQICIKTEYVEDSSLDRKYETLNHTVPIAENNESIKEDNNTIEVETIVNKIKRKRGRPRKITNLNETHIKKPKGKRGRPRKIIVDNNGIIRKQESVITGSPRKKIKVFDFIRTGKRGRPRKIQVTEHSHSDNNNDIEAKDTDVLEGTVEQSIELLEIVPSSQNTGKVIEKKNKVKDSIYKKHMDKIRKRKRSLQHKALMRNYIATSVRCMSFIKK